MTEARGAQLARLFAPSSVAVVGASAAPEKAGHQVLRALANFAGEVFAINPKAQEILGRPAWPSLRALSRPVDLVLFALPAAAVVDAVREAIACNCGAGVILSGGFSESGVEGAELQAELERICKVSRFRLLGPNTAGFINTHAALAASFLPAAAGIGKGAVAVVAQSAGINLTVSFLLAKLGYGVSCAVGLGNAIDVDASAMLEYLADEPNTRAIALYLEGVSHGRRLYEALQRATSKKPVVAFTVGKKDIAEFAQSHTGNLLGSHAVRTAALRQAGAVVVDSTLELAVAAAALSQYRLPPRRHAGVGIITAQAGAGLVMLDLLKSSGVSVPSLEASTVALIESRLPPLTFVKNPVDTGRPGASFGEVVCALAHDPQIDAVIAYALHEPAALSPAELLPEVSRALTKPLLFGTMGLSAEIAAVKRELQAAGVFVAESPEELAIAVRALVRDATLRARPCEPSASAVRAMSDLVADDGADEDSAKRLLESVGIATPKRVACGSHAEAHAALRRLAKPVVAKLLATEVAHKTEVGGVHLDISDEAALDRALEQLDAIPLGSGRRYLIEEMAPPGLELIVGATRDVDFGPTVMVGLGGVLAEVLRDTAVRLAPLSLAEADDMLDDLRCAALFDGVRGGPKLCREGVVQAIVALGNLISAHSNISELEVNPLRVLPRGVVALDALLIRAPSRVFSARAD